MSWLDTGFFLSIISKETIMKYLIIGLGNIGEEYEETRHNIGFMALDHLTKEFDTSFKLDKLAFKSEIKYKGRSIH